MLNHDKGALPLYSQLEQILRKKIEHGEYCKGDFLPTEKQIMEEYDTSRMTVRQALAELAKDNYIKSRRGIGTEVIYEKIDEHMQNVISFTEEMKRHNITMQTSYCKIMKIKPSERVAMALNIPITEQCYCLLRVRDVEGKPLVYTKTYLKRVVDLKEDESYYMESLYKYLNEEHGIKIEKARDTLEATLPNEEVMKFLNIDKNMPIFKRTRQTYLKDGEVFEFSICYYPGNRYKYTVDL